jgi:hypothetical protein
MRALALLGALALCACQTTTAVRTQCLPMRTVTPAEHAELLTEVQALPIADTAIIMAVSDWIAMRDANRACLSR